MIFTVKKCPEGERDYAPWCLFVDGIELLNGLETETEALSIVERYDPARHFPPKLFPFALVDCSPD